MYIVHVQYTVQSVHTVYYRHIRMLVIIAVLNLIFSHAGVLGAPRPDAGHAPAQRPRHAVPLGALLRGPRPVRPRARLARRLRTRALDQEVCTHFLNLLIPCFDEVR